MTDLRIGSSETFSRLDNLDGPERCIASGLASTSTARQWHAFERYVLAAFRYPSNAMASVLCEVLGQRLEDINNEDVVDVLAEIADPAAVGVLEDTIHWQPSWDEFHWLAVKAVWALARIGTLEALQVLRDTASIGPVEVRDAATNKLRVAGH